MTVLLHGASLARGGLCRHRQVVKTRWGHRVAFHRARSRGSLVRGTNGPSNGVVPWLKTLDSSVAAVNEGGRQKGAACVYLKSWHADIEEFLELPQHLAEQVRAIMTEAVEAETTFALDTLAEGVPGLTRALTRASKPRRPRHHLFR